MTIPIGKMPYLNSVLFYQGFDGTPFDLQPMVPTAMAKAAHEGRVDAGPIPLLDALALMHDGFEPLGGLCIATARLARSILLYSKVPIDELAGKTVAVTDETSTAARLLRVLLSLRFGVEPHRYAGLDAPYDAALFIGDSALKLRHGIPGYPHRYDLGEIWQQWTGLPTVFALWVARRSMPSEAKASLERAVRVGLEAGLDELPEAAAGRPDLGMNGRDVREYLEGFSFEAGEPERQAIERFTGYVERLPKNEEVLHAR